ncbi:DUF5667 domain-containing protein [Streptomyces sp. NPDC006984]|uniref:DUF5667 domain-containing protein n=1 Tax=Streptomyces sp. NPDC006984 TaxID=3155463 RepID=UPI0033E0699B
MIANVSAHRRASAFAQALEDQAAEQPDESVEETDHARLLSLAHGLGELPKPEMDPEVKVVQRAQLVAAMEAMLQEGGAEGATGPTVPEQRTHGRGAHRASPLGKLRPRSRWSKGLAAGGLTVGVAAGAFSGVAAASSDALPGDSLYGLKRGMEDFRLGLADDDSDKGELYLDQASTRLSEARRLMERDRAGSLDHESLSEVRRALTGMRNDVTEGHRLLSAAYERDGSLAPMATLDSFSRSHRNTWDGLRNRLPVQLTDVGEEVSSAFDAIDQEVGPLESLLPRPAEKERRTGTRSPGTPQDAGRDTTPGSAAPSAPVSGGVAKPGEEGSTPRPSGSGTETEDEGLLGGTTGGLLDPPAQEESPAPSDQDGEEPAPDVTIPPLLPGILPGLGLDAEDG